MPVTTPAVLSLCASLGPGVHLSTADLLDRLRLTEPNDYSMLQSLVRRRDLDAVHTVGLPVTRRGRRIRPLLWHAPKAVCTCCGGSGFLSNAAGLAPAQPFEAEEW